MKKSLIGLVWLLGLIPLMAAPPAIIPAPRQVTWTTDVFRITGSIQVIASDPKAAEIADSVVTFLKQHGAKAQKSHSITAGIDARIQLQLDPHGQFKGKPEGYLLTINRQLISLTAATEQGLFWGFRTLQQLLPTRTARLLQGCTILDYPAFPIRGLMHDTGRSFIPLDTLYQHLDLLSRYKLNTFHWHLTEDIAWRLASDSLPQLTEARTMLRDPGAYYSKEQVRAVLALCRRLHIQVIPELDMPGHSAAFKRATGVDMQTEQGKKLLTRLLREVCALFDGPYIHLGTDEVAFRDPDFVSTMMAVVQNCGKQVIGWYPGAGMDTTAIRQLWMSSRPPLPSMRVIDSRNLYLNHYATQADLISLFQRNFCDVPEATTRHLGAIACIWNDRRPANIAQLELLNGLYPIMLTFAERTWRGGGTPETQAGVVLTDSAAFAEFEERLLSHKRQFWNHRHFPYVSQRHLQWKILKPFPNDGNLHMIFPPEQGNLDFPGVTATGATIYLRHTWGPSVVRAYLSDPKPNHTAYAYTYVYAPKRQRVRLWVDFHNYGRSEKDASPPAGSWDYKGSTLWINGEQLHPGDWQQPAFRPTSLEHPYRNEPYEVREPLPVLLQKGWNKLLIKLPVGNFTSPDYRLVKWLFTCVFVRKQGQLWETADDLIFSPTRNRQTP